MCPIQSNQNVRLANSRAYEKVKKNVFRRFDDPTHAIFKA
jgi:hypothetical protein